MFKSVFSLKIYSNSAIPSTKTMLNTLLFNLISRTQLISTIFPRLSLATKLIFELMPSTIAKSVCISIDFII